MTRVPLVTQGTQASLVLLVNLGELDSQVTGGSKDFKDPADL